MHRWTPGVPFLLLLSCQAARLAPASPAPSHPATTDGVVDVGGLSLHIHCVGGGSPTVVLDAGLGNDGSVWSDVQPGIGRFTRACAYDRAGAGSSSAPAATPHTNRQMARELHALLDRAGIAGPYVLVGHSLGGVNVRLFASEHPEEIAGMVLLDSVSDEQPSRYWALLSDAEMVEFRAGLTKLHEGVDFDTLVAGIADMRASSRSIGDRPLIVLSGGKEPAPAGASPQHTAQMFRVWHEMQSNLLRLSTNAVQIVAQNSGHYIQWEAPTLVVASVREVVEASRKHARINGRALGSLAHEGVHPP